MSASQRELGLAVRQALLIALGALEVYLGMERSAPPRRVRRSRLSRPVVDVTGDDHD